MRLVIHSIDHISKKCSSCSKMTNPAIFCSLEGKWKYEYYCPDCLSKEDTGIDIYELISDRSENEKSLVKTVQTINREWLTDGTEKNKMLKNMLSIEEEDEFYFNLPKVAHDYTQQMLNGQIIDESELLEYLNYHGNDKDMVGHLRQLAISRVNKQKEELDAEETNVTVTNIKPNVVYSNSEIGNVLSNKSTYSLSQCRNNRLSISKESKGLSAGNNHNKRTKTKNDFYISMYKQARMRQLTYKQLECLLYSREFTKGDKLMDSMWEVIQNVNGGISQGKYSDYKYIDKIEGITDMALNKGFMSYNQIKLLFHFFETYWNSLQKSEEDHISKNNVVQFNRKANEPYDVLE